MLIGRMLRRRAPEVEEEITRWHAATLQSVCCNGLVIVVVAKVEVQGEWLMPSQMVCDACERPCDVTFISSVGT